MNDELRELGRRAIAAGFRYPPGSVWRDTDGRKYACMRSNGEGRAIMQPMDGGWSQCVSANDNEWMIPDLSDPATLGCLLAQVRERNPSAQSSPHNEWPFDPDTLVQWLEAAPKAAP